MNARSIIRVRTPWSAAAQSTRAECLAWLPARPPDDSGAALTREEKRILARDAAVLSALAIAALTLVLLILERAYA
jgi:hypothetical protein